MSEAQSRRPGDASHPNVRLLEKLYSSIRDGDAAGAASCYAPNAHFEDIAFRLDGRERIHEMWQMVCDGKVKVTFDSLAADNSKGSGHWVARYTFRDTGRPVVNDTVSEFLFAGGLIRSHLDRCDALKWARQAFPFPKSLAAMVEPLRRRMAMRKLDEFIKKSAA